MPGFMKKTMVYLGLLDDEYDDFDEYDDRAPRGMTPPVARVDSVPDEPAAAPPAAMGRIRTLPRESATPAGGAGGAVGSMPAGGSTVAPRPTAMRPMAVDSAPKVTVVAPNRFGDAKDIADCLKANRPVIVNLQIAERDLQRRMIDFCSGVTYALSGEMEKVADQVFLLAPTNVKISDEERQRLQERGYGRS
jgi:cell division inhibitor SepF